MTWTKDMDEALLVRLSRGLTSSEIARQFTRDGIQMSRNAIIGRKKRLGLCRDAGPRKRACPVTHQAPRKPSIRLVAVAPAPLRDYRPAPPGGIKISDMRIDSCRWPIGDPLSPDFTYCGAEAHEGKPYCTAHCRVAYNVRRGGSFRPWAPKGERLSVQYEIAAE